MLALSYRAADLADIPAIARLRAEGEEGGASAERMARYLTGEHHPQQALLPRVLSVAQEGEALAFLFATTARVAQPSPAPLRIRLSPADGCLQVDVFKRRGGVMSAPLLLDVATERRTAAGTQPCVPAKNKHGPSPLRRPASFNRRYPIGGRETRIWNRALARADEVRRVPGPDPRGRSRIPSRHEGPESTVST